MNAEETPRIHCQEDESSSGMGYKLVLRIQWDARNRENHLGALLSCSWPCRATSGRGRVDTKRRARKEAVCTAPGGSVLKVAVVPFPVRVNAV